MYQYGVGVLVPVSVCGARCAPCRRCGGVAHRPRHTKLPCCICHRQRRAAWARLSPTVRVHRQSKKRDTRKGISLFGAGDRTRTGTLSPAVDFESVGLFGIQWNVVEPSGIFHLTKHTQPVVFAPKKLQFSAKQPQSKRF